MQKRIMLPVKGGGVSVTRQSTLAFVVVCLKVTNSGLEQRIRKTQFAQ